MPAGTIVYMHQQVRAKPRRFFLVAQPFCIAFLLLFFKFDFKQLLSAFLKVSTAPKSSLQILCSFARMSLVEPLQLGISVKHPNHT